MSPLVWTTKSTRNLAGALTAAGHRVSDRTVARMLAAMGFSLQANAKVIEGRRHEDRDAQFDHLNRCVGEHIAAGLPVISVDTKKKELVRPAPGHQQMEQNRTPAVLPDHHELVRGNGSAEFVVEGAVAPPGHLGVGGEVGLAEHG